MKSSRLLSALILLQAHGRLCSRELAERLEIPGQSLPLIFFQLQDATVALADEYLDLALAALDRVSLVPGPRSDLVAIARFVTERDR